MRSSIVRHTADIFDPHLFLVDKSRSACAARCARPC